MVELSVDKSYAEAFVVKKFGQIKHRFNVALEWAWDAHSVGLHACCSRAQITHLSHSVPTFLLYEFILEIDTEIKFEALN